jgi:hypothetical protein
MAEYYRKTSEPDWDLIRPKYRLNIKKIDSWSETTGLIELKLSGIKECFLKPLFKIDMP